MALSNWNKFTKKIHAQRKRASKGGKKVKFSDTLKICGKMKRSGKMHMKGGAEDCDDIETLKTQCNVRNLNTTTDPITTTDQITTTDDEVEEVEEDGNLVKGVNSGGRSKKNKSKGKKAKTGGKKTKTHKKHLKHH